MVEAVAQHFRISSRASRALGLSFLLPPGRASRALLASARLVVYLLSMCKVTNEVLPCHKLTPRANMALSIAIRKF